MENSEFTYDIFISYAREEYDWVKNSLYIPLTQCKTPQGKRPGIFLDEDNGLQISQSYLDALAKAIFRSRCVILVYSTLYFNKQMTQWELTKTLQIDPTGSAGKIFPILLDQEAKSLIPMSINHIHYLDVKKHPDHWLSRLIHDLGLNITSEVPQLEWAAPLGNVVIHNTLPPISLSLSDRGQPGSEDQIVELTANIDGFQGTLKQKTSQGVAVFNDLSFRHSVGHVIITASSDGYKSSSSNPFEVVSTPPPPPPGPGVSVPYGRSPENTQVHFFETSKAFIVVDLTDIRVFDLSGQLLGKVRVHSKMKKIQCTGSLIALADWCGNIFLIRETGECKEIQLQPGNPSYAIPGNCILIGEQVMVGMWNGDMVRIDSSSCEKSLSFSHPAGILDFQSDGRVVCLVDFQGHFCVYHENQPVRQFPVERSIIGMKRFKDHIVMIGEKKLYQYSLAEWKMTPWHSNLANISHAMPSENRILALDETGSGLFVDEQLVPRIKFHATKGARPYCIGVQDEDHYVSFVYPDHTYALLKNGQIVYTHAAGILSFNPRIDSLALGSTGGIQISDGSRLQSLFGKA